MRVRVLHDEPRMPLGERAHEDAAARERVRAREVGVLEVVRACRTASPVAASESATGVSAVDGRAAMPSVLRTAAESGRQP